MMKHQLVKGRGPLAEHADGFAAELACRGYSQSAVHLRLWLFNSLSRWLEDEHVDLAELTRNDLERFVTERRSRGFKSWVSLRSLGLPVDYLRAAAVIPPLGRASDGPVEELLERYRSYLVAERGLAAKTILGYESVAMLFLARYVSGGGLDLSGLGGADVLAFARMECSHRPTPSAQQAMSAFRSLLRYLHVAGLTGGGLVDAVPAIAAPRSGLPKGLGEAEVSALLGSCNRNRPVGRRDYAILLLLVRLGLRTGEVAAMQVGDVDWRCGQILIRGKGDRHDRLPLPADVGQALAEYLQHGRPSDTGADIFARVNAPRGALRATGVRAVVHDACIRASMVPVGAHRLRHTAATGMLRAGGTLPEIAQVLRHRRLETTTIYAKVDQDALRALTQPWPGGA